MHCFAFFYKKAIISPMEKRSVFLVALFIFAFCFSSARAAGSLNVIINEIAWMGTDVSASDEWIELYNNTSSSLNLDGWILKSEDGKPEIKLSGIISANGFYLLERTDDKTLPDVAADKIYTGALSNNGEDLKLYDSSGNIIDEVNCKNGWFSGKGKPDYRTMERINPSLAGNDSSNWQNSQNAGGTPKTGNSQGEVKAVTSQNQKKETAVQSQGNNKNTEADSGKTNPQSGSEKQLADIGGQIPKQSSSFLPVLLIALALAIFSGIIILIIKTKLKKAE